MAIKNRTALKSYFIKNAIPTEGNFADLIDSQLNQAHGVFKPDGEPLSVIAATGGQKQVLRLYASDAAANPDWMISLNPAQDPATPASGKAGFGVADGAGNTRLFVEAGSGRIGIGTNIPQFALDVVGGARVQGPLGLTVTGPVLVDGPIVPSIGYSEDKGIQFPGGSTGDRAFIRYFVESGESTKLVIGNDDDVDDRISLYQMKAERLTVYNGCVGINNITPGAALDVSAITTTPGGWFEAIRFSRPENSAITHPSSNLLFGMEDSNFYFADTTKDAEGGHRYAMTISGSSGDVSILGKLSMTGLNVKSGGNTSFAGFREAIRIDDPSFTRSAITHPGAGLLLGMNADPTARHFIFADTDRGPSGTLMMISPFGGKRETPEEPETPKVTIFGDLEVQGDLIQGNLDFKAIKNFRIDHPSDSERFLVHSVTSGPEAAVFYRGEAVLVDGACEIELPTYFEALTRKENRTVLVTPKLSNGDENSALAAGEVANGRFLVRTIDGRNRKQQFYWEVKGVRADIDPIVVEPMKTDLPTPPQLPPPSDPTSATP